MFSSDNFKTTLKNSLLAVGAFVLTSALLLFVCALVLTSHSDPESLVPFLSLSVLFLSYTALGALFAFKEKRLALCLFPSVFVTAILFITSLFFRSDSTSLAFQLLIFALGIATSLTADFIASRLCEKRKRPRRRNRR